MGNLRDCLTRGDLCIGSKYVDVQNVFDVQTSFSFAASSRSRVDLDIMWNASSCFVQKIESIEKVRNIGRIKWKKSLEIHTTFGRDFSSDIFTLIR